MPSFRCIDSIKAVVDRYDGFILDQFGVLHNGTHALDGAVECIRQLAQNKALIILSNSSSKATNTLQNLPKLGFDASWFAGGAVTSGQEAAKYIQSHFAGQKALWITWKSPKEPSPLEFLHECSVGDSTVQVAASIDDKPDFILLHGCEVWRGPGAEGNARETPLPDDYMQTGMLDNLIPQLQQCVHQGLPMICANPDFVMVRPDHTHAHMPGKIAALYRELGGTVHEFGKPHGEHFAACVSQLQLPKDRVVHVGDSLHHDIAGANAAGLDSIFVAGGIHHQELQPCELGDMPIKDKLSALFAKHGHEPTFVVPLLRM